MEHPIYNSPKLKNTKIDIGSIRQSLRARPKIIKKISEHQINQSKRKFFQKKVCLVPEKCKGAKSSYGSYPTEFAGSIQNPKKISEHQINQSKRKFSQKKYV
jgi:hypothetical protein